MVLPDNSALISAAVICAGCAVTGQPRLSTPALTKPRTRRRCMITLLCCGKHYRKSCAEVRLDSFGRGTGIAATSRSKRREILKYLSIS
jgi:hypothetical protein